MPSTARPNLLLAFIALGLFGVFTVEFSVIALLPTVVSRYGVSLQTAGWLVGWFALIAAVGGPLMVLWLSRYPRRRVMIGALGIFASSSLASAFAPDFWTLLALRVPAALLLPVFFSMAFAAATSLFPPERAAHATSMALMGESVGLVFGVPLIALIASSIAYEAAFLFCAAVNVVAICGLLALPKDNDAAEATAASAGAVLRKPVFWLAVLTTVAVLAAMFSLYSYAAEYFAQLGMSGTQVSLLMMTFGAGGIAGNFIAGRMLMRGLKATVLGYPLMLALIYGLLQLFAGPSVPVMLLLTVVWGAAHMAGLVVSQFWIASAGKEAPEFASSLFVSAANLGVMLGAAAGGWMLSLLGMHGTIVAGWLFAAIAAVSVVLSPAIRGRGKG